MRKKLYAYIFICILGLSGGLIADDGANETIITTALLPPTAFDMAVMEDFSTDTAETIALPAAAPAYTFPKPLPGISTSPDFGKTLFDANLVAMLGLNVADYLSTREALKYPGLEESNPIMKPFVKSPVAFAAIKMGTTALTYWSLKGIFKKNRTAAWIVATASNVLLSYVVANNLQHIQRAKLIR